MTALRRILPYGIATVLVVAGLFFGSVAYRMQTHHESFPVAVVNQVVHVPAPEEVFHRDRIYALILGIDYDYDEKDQPFSSHARSDTIMVAGIDFTAKATRMISILRDTDVLIGGRDTKINGAYSTGGVRLADEVIGDFLGLPTDGNGRHFDRYVVVRVNALKDLVNAIGGIDVPVAQAMDYDDNWGHLHIHLKPGMQHLNGEEAQGYVRFRHDACSDPCRAKRQQQVIRIILARLKRDRFNDLTHVAQLISVFRRDVDTNLSSQELTSLAWSFKDADVANLAHADTLGYVDVKDTLDGQTVIADDAQKARLVAELLGSYVPESVPPPRAVAAVLPPTVHVVVQNGSGYVGAAGMVAKTLRAHGYIVDAIGDADSFGYDTTQLQSEADAATVERVRADIGIADATIVPAPVVPARATTKTPAVVRVIVGKDYAVAAAPSPAPALVK